MAGPDDDGLWRVDDGLWRVDVEDKVTKACKITHFWCGDLFVYCVPYVVYRRCLISNYVLGVLG